MIFSWKGMLLSYRKARLIKAQATKPQHPQSAGRSAVWGGKAKRPAMVFSLDTRSEREGAGSDENLCQMRGAQF